MSENTEKIELSKDQILEALGLDKNVSLEDFKKSLSSDWLRRENLYKDEKVKTDLHGWVFGATSNELKKKLKSFGVEISKDEIQNNTLEEFFEVGLSKLKDLHNEEIEITKRSGTSSENTKVYEEQINKLKTELNNKEDLLGRAREEFEKKEKEIIAGINRRDKEAYKSKLMTALKFSESVDEMKRRGFNSYMEDNYKIDKDSSGSFQITDVNGKPIENEKIIGKWYTPEEVYKREAIKHNLYKQNESTAESKDYAPETKKVEIKEKESNGRKFFVKPVGLG